MFAILLEEYITDGELHPLHTHTQTHTDKLPVYIDDKVQDKKLAFGAADLQI